MIACFVGTSVHAVTSNFADLFDTAATSAEGVTHGAAPKFCHELVDTARQESHVSPHETKMTWLIRRKQKTKTN